jgi:hypothetical protein
MTLGDPASSYPESCQLRGSLTSSSHSNHDELELANSWFSSFTGLRRIPAGPSGQRIAKIMESRGSDPSAVDCRRKVGMPGEALQALRVLRSFDGDDRLDDSMLLLVEGKGGDR